MNDVESDNSAKASAGIIWERWVRGIMSRGRDERNLSGASLAYRLPDATALDEQKTCGCYVQVWLDNIPLFNGRDGDVPNVNSVPVSMIESIEFYSGPAEAPARYSMLNSQCGVLVIHTRRDR